MLFNRQKSNQGFFFQISMNARMIHAIKMPSVRIFKEVTHVLARKDSKETARHVRVFDEIQRSVFYDPQHTNDGTPNHIENFVNVYIFS